MNDSDIQNPQNAPPVNDPSSIGFDQAQNTLSNITLPVGATIAIQLGPFRSNCNPFGISYPVSGAVVDVVSSPHTPGVDPFSVYPFPGSSPITAVTDLDGLVNVPIPFPIIGTYYWRCQYPPGTLDASIPQYAATLFGFF